MILVIHYPIHQDDPSTIHAVLDIKTHQAYQQIKAAAENLRDVKKVIEKLEKNKELTRLEFTAIMAPV